MMHSQERRIRCGSPETFSPNNQDDNSERFCGLQNGLRHFNVYNVRGSHMHRVTDLLDRTHVWGT